MRSPMGKGRNYFDQFEPSLKRNRDSDVLPGQVLDGTEMLKASYPTGEALAIKMGESEKRARSILEEGQELSE